MAVIGEAEVRVVPDTKGFAQQVTREVEAPLTGSAKKIGAAFAAAFAGGAALRGLKSLVDAASDAQEATSKVSVVFGEASSSVLQFAEDSAVAFGQSRNQALEATGTFGNLFRALNIGEKQAASLSTSIVGLASDLASFNNADVEEVLLALRSGLVGETEPLRRFGVQLSAVRIEEEALRLGLAATKDELDAAAKAQAAYSLIMKDTALAQGDFARTSDGLANQQRILVAEFENAKTELGNGLVPAANLLIGTLREDALPAFLDLAETAIPLVVAGLEAALPLFGATTDLLVAATPAIDLLVAGLEAIPDPLLAAAAGGFALSKAFQAVNFGAAAKGVTGFLTAITPAGALFGTVAAGALLVNQSIQEGNEAARQLGDTVRTGLQQDLAAAANPLEVLQEKFWGVRDAITDLRAQRAGSSAPWDADFRRDLGLGIEELSKVEDEIVTIERVATGLGARFGITTEQALRLATVNGIDLTQGLAAVEGAFSEVVAGSRNAEAAFEGVGAAGEATAESVKAATDALREQADFLRGQLDPLFAFVQAQEALREAQDAAKEATATYGAESAEAAQANREAAQAALENEAAQVDLAAAIGDGTLTADSLNATLDRLVATGAITGAMADTVRQDMEGLSGGAKEVARQALEAAAGVGQIGDVASARSADLQSASDSAGSLADRLKSIPGQITADIRVETGPANAIVQTFVNNTRRLLGSLGALVPRISLPGGGAARWGNVFEFARGGITPAHIARGDIIRYAEPETGGEAFIPRRGNRDRSLSILDVAARWYGAKVIPMAAGGLVNVAGVTASAKEALSFQTGVTNLLLYNTEFGQKAIKDAEGDLTAAFRAVEPLAEAYRELAAAVGTAEADLALQGKTVEEVSALLSESNRIVQERIRQEEQDEQARERVAERLRQRREELIAEDRRIARLRFDIGETSTDEYLGFLREQLEGLERYSEDWARIYGEITNIERSVAAERERAAAEAARVQEEAAAEAARRQEEARREQERRIEEARRFTQRFVDAFRFDVAGTARDNFLDPAAGETILDGLTEQLRRAREVQGLLQTLRQRGFDPGLLEGLAAGGTQNLGALKALAQTDVGTFNQLTGQLASTGVSIAGLFGATATSGAAAEEDPLLKFFDEQAVKEEEARVEQFAIYGDMLVALQAIQGASEALVGLGQTAEGQDERRGRQLDERLVIARDQIRQVQFTNVELITLRGDIARAIAAVGAAANAAANAANAAAQAARAR